jgi:RNA polymerase sigma-70 factor (ECF subfamily)
LHFDESSLIQRSQNGDPKAFEQLYRANAAKVHGLCLRLCGQKELAEDLTQESFIRAWQKLDSFRGDSAFGSWLYRLTSNVVIGYLRSQSKWKMVSFDAQDHEAKLGFAELDTSRPDIEKKLSGLPDQARVVVILHEYLGYQHNEIAELTGMAVGTSKSHLHRAKDLLRSRAAA